MVESRKRSSNGLEKSQTTFANGQHTGPDLKKNYGILILNDGTRPNRLRQQIGKVR
ncbi:MAG: hypothetical protein Ct9H90mP16_17080 [Candidatus Poseidoniales archaeon]|nr:MAG: hypothetical protein Ct9H90mP16_17080 [Candidatus Poseidoniales archaeon]